MKFALTKIQLPCHWLAVLGLVHVLQQVQWLLGLISFVS